MKNSLLFFVALHCLPVGLVATSAEVPVLRQLGYLTTEQSHPVTHNLSRVMRGGDDGIVKGLQLLHEVDQGVVLGFDHFVATFYKQMHTRLLRTRAAGGKCYLVGSGSSGRVAIDLAAKDPTKTVVDVMAGGDSALIRAREGFEDSATDGASAINALGLSKKDMVVLISASGSAMFNVGAGKAARAVGATVYYFCNSAAVPKETQVLFDVDGVTPVTVDIGPQAITGSTRLQAATLALLCLGVVCLDQDPVALRKQLLAGNKIIADNVNAIAAVVAAETAVFSAPDANFRQVQDKTERGYVTFVATEQYARAVVIDTVETPPTFSTNPPVLLSEFG